MRDYKTVAQRVLQRRDAYVLAKKRKRQMLIKYAAVPACLFLVIGAGIRIWKQTDSGRQILEQNKVEMTDAATTIADSTDSSNDSVLYETESQSGSDDPTPIQTGEVLQVTTDPTETDAAVSSADAESEPEHNAVVETQQTERVITEVIVLEVPVTQETEPTPPEDEKPATKPSVQSTEPEPPATVPDPTDPTDPIWSDHESHATVPMPTDPPDPSWSEPEPPATVPKPTDPPDPSWSEPEPPATVPMPDTDPSDDPTIDGSSSTTKSDNYVPSITAATTTSVTTAKKPTNYTITVEEFTPTREQLSNVTHETVSMNFSENYDSFQQLFENAGAAVRCKVLSVAYTIMRDTPYTVYNIEITQSICGSFIAGDKLSIVQYGGYLVPASTGNDQRPPNSSQETSLIERQIAGSESPVVSQEYVLFLTQDDVFDGAYEALHENEGVFRYDPKTGELIRSVEQDTAINSSSYKHLLEAGEQFVNADS